jgi:hypothetical protein
MDKTAVELFALISGEDSVRLLINDHSMGSFNLRKSRAAMDAMIECHDKNINKEPVPDPSFGTKNSD